MHACHRYRSISGPCDKSTCSIVWLLDKASPAYLKQSAQHPARAEVQVLVCHILHGQALVSDAPGSQAWRAAAVARWWRSTRLPPRLARTSGRSATRAASGGRLTMGSWPPSRSGSHGHGSFLFISPCTLPLKNIFDMSEGLCTTPCRHAHLQKSYRSLPGVQALGKNAAAPGMQPGTMAHFMRADLVKAYAGTHGGSAVSVMQTGTRAQPVQQACSFPPH